MKTNLLHIIGVAGMLLGMSSCGNDTGTRINGTIKLGDSATIITEKDSQYLKDDVMDVGPRRPVSTDTAVAAPGQKTLPASVAVTNKPADKGEPEASGYTIDFGNTKLIAAGLKLKDGKKQNPEKDDGLTYALTSGTLESAKLMVYGAKKVTVKQRYQSNLILKSAMGTVDLSSLGHYTSGWETISGNTAGDAWRFSLNSLNKINYIRTSNSKISNAADRELRKRRTSRRTIQYWMKEIKGIRNVDDKPCEIILDNVQWQISGTDARGKAFNKTIRVDA